MSQKRGPRTYTYEQLEQLMSPIEYVAYMQCDAYTKAVITKDNQLGYKKQRVNSWLESFRTKKANYEREDANSLPGQETDRDTNC